MNNNKLKFIFIGILPVVIIILIFTFFKGFNNNSNFKESIIDVVEKEEVLNIVGLTDSGYKRMSDDLKTKYELSGNDYIDFSYYDIAKVYGLSDNAVRILDKYENYYIIKPFPTVDNPHEIKDSIKMNYNNSDIIVNYNVSVKPTQDYNQSGIRFDKEITFVLKKDSDNKYYLYSVKIEEK